jgi:hypothetical protein
MELAARPTSVSVRAHPRQLAAHRAHPLAELEGLLHLPENLRLPHHHGVQAGGHPEEVEEGLFALVQVGVVKHLRAPERRQLATQPVRQLLQRAEAVELHPVARRDEECLGGGGAHPLQERGLRLGGERHPLAQREWRRFV